MKAFKLPHENNSKYIITCFVMLLTLVWNNCAAQGNDCSKMLDDLNAKLIDITPNKIKDYESCVTKTELIYKGLKKGGQTITDLPDEESKLIKAISNYKSDSVTTRNKIAEIEKKEKKDSLTHYNDQKTKTDALLNSSYSDLNKIIEKYKSRLKSSYKKLMSYYHSLDNEDKVTEYQSKSNQLS